MLYSTHVWFWGWFIDGFKTSTLIYSPLVRVFKSSKVEMWCSDITTHTHTHTRAHKACDFNGRVVFCSVTDIWWTAREVEAWAASTKTNVNFEAKEHIFPDSKRKITFIIRPSPFRSWQAQRVQATFMRPGLWILQDGTRVRTSSLGPWVCASSLTSLAEMSGVYHKMQN